MNALELKRNTWYEVTEDHEKFRKGDIVKRGKWVANGVVPSSDDEVSVAFYKKGTKRQVWGYLRPDQVKEL